MKSWRKLLLGVVLLLVLAAVLLWFLPARWALSWMQPQWQGLQLQQVSGSIWNGSAGALLDTRGQTLGRLQWQLSRRALLGQPQLRWQLAGPKVTFSADVRRRAGDEVEARDVSLRVTSDVLSHPLVTAWGQPRGELRARIPHAVLRAGWPMQMEASVTWRDAVMHTVQGDIALGQLGATLQARGGLIHADLRDAGQGPLQLKGTLQVSPLGWRLDATLRTRQADPPLRRWLATLGTPAADGSVQLQRHGGLAIGAPAPSTH